MGLELVALTHWRLRYLCPQSCPSVLNTDRARYHQRVEIMCVLYPMDEMGGRKRSRSQMG